VIPSSKVARGAVDSWSFIGDFLSADYRVEPMSFHAYSTAFVDTICDRMDEQRAGGIQLNMRGD
jgi:hypothetical protein